MHYYSFNIGDYISHTADLEPLEDLAYRRLIDFYYQTEKPIPLDEERVCRKIRMRSHCDAVAFALREFFERTPDGFRHKRIEEEITKFHEKSDKARRSAEARWAKKPKGKQRDTQKDANALQPQSGRNANHKPITKNQEPIKRGTFIPPTRQEVTKYCSERGNGIDPQAFLNHYQANGWVRGKTKVKDWKACVRTWEKASKATQTAFTGGI